MNYTKSVLPPIEAYTSQDKLNQLQQINCQPHPNSEQVLVVTLCLSSCEDCNGRYEDNTGHFKIQCKCKCHFEREKSKSKSAIDLRHQATVMKTYNHIKISDDTSNDDDTICCHNYQSLS